MAVAYLHDFEKPIAELEDEIANLEKLASRSPADLSANIQSLRERSLALKREIYAKLTPWQRVQVARDPNRPLFTDYLNALVEDFVELHGDRAYGDDKAIVTGFGRIGQQKVMIVGHKRGKTTAERVQCNFGSPHPEGYRKALLKMQLAEKCHVPVVCFINTAGAYPGIGAEERGQAQAIARNLFEMSRLRTPIVCLVIGEGGSGGALGIGVGDRLAILENAYFSVISPEGCAAILWKDGGKAPQAAQVLKLAPKDLLALGIVDEIVPEPVGGAHHAPEAATQLVKAAILRMLEELVTVPIPELVERRYARHRRIGRFLEGEAAKVYFESTIAQASARAQAKAVKEAGKEPAAAATNAPREAITPASAGPAAGAPPLVAGSPPATAVTSAPAVHAAPVPAAPVAPAASALPPNPPTTPNPPASAPAGAEPSTATKENAGAVSPGPVQSVQRHA